MGIDANDARRTGIISYLQRNFNEGTAGEVRIIGAAIGILSLFLPWGNVIARDPVMPSITMENIGVSPAGLLSSGDGTMMLISSLLIIFTIAMLVERWAVLGHIASVTVLLVALPQYMSRISTQEGLLRTDNVVGLGTMAAILSATIVLVSFLFKRRQGTAFSKGRIIRTDERVVEGEMIIRRRPPY